MFIYVCLMVSLSDSLRLRDAPVLGLPPNVSAVYSDEEIAKFYPPVRSIDLGNFPTPIFSAPSALPKVDVESKIGS